MQQSSYLIHLIQLKSDYFSRSNWTMMKKGILLNLFLHQSLDFQSNTKQLEDLRKSINLSIWNQLKWKMNMFSEDFWNVETLSRIQKSSFSAFLLFHHEVNASFSKDLRRTLQMQEMRDFFQRSEFSYHEEFTSWELQECSMRYFRRFEWIFIKFSSFDFG